MRIKHILSRLGYHKIFLLILGIVLIVGIIIYYVWLKQNTALPSAIIAVLALLISVNGQLPKASKNDYTITIKAAEVSDVNIREGQERLTLRVTYDIHNRSKDSDLNLSFKSFMMPDKTQISFSHRDTEDAIGGTVTINKGFYRDVSVKYSAIKNQHFIDFIKNVRDAKENKEARIIDYLYQAQAIYSYSDGSDQDKSDVQAFGHLIYSELTGFTA